MTIVTKAVLLCNRRIALPKKTSRAPSFFLSLGKFFRKVEAFVGQKRVEWNLGSRAILCRVWRGDPFPLGRDNRGLWVISTKESAFFRMRILLSKPQASRLLFHRQPLLIWNSEIIQIRLKAVLCGEAGIH